MKRIISVSIVVILMVIFILYIQVYNFVPAQTQENEISRDFYNYIAEKGRGGRAEYLETNESITDSAKETASGYDSSVLREEETGNDLTFTTGNSSIPYNVPLEEVAERIEYIYTYEHMLSEMPRDYGELGPLPEGNVRLTIYTAEGNKLLFLPEGKGNKLVLVNGEPCELYWEEEKGQYLFYCIDDFTTQEGGVPVNSAGYGSEPWIFRCALKERDMPFGDDEYYFPRYDLDNLTRLGEVDVSFEPRGRFELPAVSVRGNEYIDVMVRTVQETLAEKGDYGDFEMYLGTYGRIWYPYNKYYDIDTTAFQASGCIVGENLEQYFFFTIEDNGKVDVMEDRDYVTMNQAYSLYPPLDAQTETGTYPYYFIDDKCLAVNNQNLL